MKNILKTETEICVTFLSAYLFIYLPLYLVFQTLLGHDFFLFLILFNSMHFIRYLIGTNEKLCVVLVGPCNG